MGRRFKPHSIAGTAFGLVGAGVVLNAATTDQFCIRHPLSFSCVNEAALRPDYPHENPEPLGPSAPRIISVTAASTTASDLGRPFLSGR
jgi:hypothetical protein